MARAGPSTQKAHMSTKEQALDTMILLSAIESWAFSVGKPLPDYLHEKLSNAVDALRAEILEDAK